MSGSREAVLRAVVMSIMAAGLIVLWWWPRPHVPGSDKPEGEAAYDSSASDTRAWSEDDWLATLTDELAPATARLQAASALAKPGERNVGLLRRLLDHRSPAVQRFAAMGLGEIGRPALPAVPRLIELARNSEDGVQIPAIDAAVRIDAHDPAVLDAVRSGLESPSASVQASSGDAFVQIVRLCPEQAETLEAMAIALLDSPQSPLRMVAVEALAAFRPPRVERLLRLLEHTDAALRIRSIAALGRLGSAAAPAIEALVIKANSPERMEHNVARRALARLARDNRDPLATVVRSESDLVNRMEAALWLIRIAPDEAGTYVPAVRLGAQQLGDQPFWWGRLRMAVPQMKAQADALVREWRASPVQHLRELAAACDRRPADRRQELNDLAGELQDAAPVVRARAAYSLGTLRSEAEPVVNSLYDRDQDSDEGVRRAVHWATDQIDSPVGPMRMMQGSRPAN